MSVKTATVIGATGLIGGHIVDLLESRLDVQTIRVLVRRPVKFPNPKVETKLTDFADPESFKMGIDGSDVVFCAVGTTQNKVKGNLDAYRKVDYDIPVNAARFCAETGCQNFVLVSSVGADSANRNFYLRIKGEVEDEVRQKAVSQVAVFRPSLLLGNREESRPAEKISQTILPLFSFLFLGKLSRYKPIQARDVAAAMVCAALQNNKGFYVYEYNQIMQLLDAKP